VTDFRTKKDGKKYPINSATKKEGRYKTHGPKILKYDKSIGRPKLPGYDLVKSTKDDGVAKRYATQCLDKYPDKYVSFDFKEDKEGNNLVYMVKHSYYR